MMVLNFIKHRAKAYSKDEDGVAIIELAIVLPLLIIVLMGMVEVFFLFDARAKAKRTADTLAIVVSQEHILTDDLLNDYRNVAEHLMWPNRADNAAFKYGISVWEVNSGTQVWSSGTFDGSGNSAGLNNLMREGRTDLTCPYVIVGSVLYDHSLNTPISYVIGDITLEYHAHYFPRPVDQIRIKDGQSIEVLAGCEINL